MATNKRVFTLRLQDDVFDKIEYLAEEEHRTISRTPYFIAFKKSHVNFILYLLSSQTTV